MEGSPFDANTTIVVLSQKVYNNSAENSSLVATFAATEPTEQSASWSTDTGVDSYLTSSVDAALPLPIAPAPNSTIADSSAYASLPMKLLCLAWLDGPLGSDVLPGLLVMVKEHGPDGERKGELGLASSGGTALFSQGIRSSYLMKYHASTRGKPTSPEDQA